MFADALAKVSPFTIPIIVSMRFHSGKVESGLGTCTVLNDEGWMATAAHIARPAALWGQHRQEIQEYQRQVDAINADPKLYDRQKRIKIGQIKPEPNPNWITHGEFCFGWPGVRIVDPQWDIDADLSMGRLEPFNPAWVTNYPVLKKPTNLRPGTSLCRLGFPFHKVEAKFDVAANRFTFTNNPLPAPFFPIEGIFTREVTVSRESDGKQIGTFIETSSPGLRGQSGGPIFDVCGNVWAIQSQTYIYDLGFSGKVKDGNQDVSYPQFLPAGWGVHPKTLVDFLDGHGVKVELSKD